MIPGRALMLVLLSGQLFVTALSLAAVTEAPPQGQITPSQPTSSVALAPPEDPLFPQDISAWTYTPEFAERFKRLKLKEPGPTGAYAVNFQVHQVEELDRCVFNVFLDNKLPIDYPEGPVGFLSFTYPMSWAFLKLSAADQQAVDGTYHGKYRDPRAWLMHGSGEETLVFFQNRTNLYPGTAVVTLTFRCDQVAGWKNSLRLKLRTTSGTAHEIGLPDHFLGWIHSTLTKWRRPEAKLTAQGLKDPNVWSYTPEFAKRFGLPQLSGPGPAGAQAMAFRVEQYHGDDHACLLDLYLNDTVPLRLPEGESGIRGLHPSMGDFLIFRDRKELDQSIASRPSYMAPDSEVFAIMELRTEGARKTFPVKQHLDGNRFRVALDQPLSFIYYRKHAFPGLSYVSLSLVCGFPRPDRGPSGTALLKIDGTKLDMMFSRQFLEESQRQVREKVELPFERQFPKMFPNVPKK